MTATPYEILRARHAETVAALLPDLIGVVDLPRVQIERVQQARLRDLVRHARELSPFHARRLDVIDAENFALEQLPIMTRSDMMAHYDDLLADRRLTLAEINAHLARLEKGGPGAAPGGDAYLLDQYHAVMSSGSSGLRGVFVYDWDAWAIAYIAYFRMLLRARRREQRFYEEVAAVIGAMNAAHTSTALFQTFSRKVKQVVFSVTAPLEQMVAGLNEAQPTILQGYPSAMALLAREARGGRLHIAPKDICVSAEPLLPEIRDALAEVWHAPVWNAWGTSEAGCMAMSCGQATGMHLSEDLVIVEPVDDEYRPVPPGRRATRVLVTNLFNKGLPLIRYEISDEVTVLDEACPCGSQFLRIADIQGRREEWFRYGDVAVHPVLFRDPLGLTPNVVEYQVLQTARGASIRACIGGSVDFPALAAKIEDSLRAMGVLDPRIEIGEVDALPRGATGKIQRFIPLAR